METLVEFLNIDMEMVENIESDVNDYLEILGLEIEIEYSMNNVLEKLSDIGNWEFINDSLIEVFFLTVEEKVLEQFPNAEIEYDVAGYSSEFEILNIDELDIKEN